MEANWHPTNGFDTLVLCLFNSGVFAGCTNFTMADHDIVFIGLRVIKWCSMYAKEYKLLCHPASATLGTIYTNITGAFPVQSFKNMQYIFLAYIYNLNAIIMQPMPSHTNSLFITAFSKVFAILRTCDYQPALNVMDNECSKAKEKHIRANKMNIQLIPPHNHHVNAAERAIAMFRNTLLPPLQLLTCFAPYRFGTNFYHKLSLYSTFCGSPVATCIIQPTRNIAVCSISTKRPLPLLGQKHYFTTTPQQEPPGHHMQLTGSTLAQPTTTTVVFISTSRRLGVSTWRKLGGCTLPIAKSLLPLNKTKPS
jgi:hypothetical protein